MAGDITHIEIPADDVERAKRFYSAIAGWEFSEMPGYEGYWLFRTSDRAGGGLGVRGQTVGSTVRIYINVDNLEQAIQAAEANGGTAVSEPQEVPGQGRWASIPDPEGSEIGLWEPAQVPAAAG